MNGSVFIINCYASGDFLRIIFNGIAGIFGDGSYLVAMNMAALLGFVAIFMRAAFDRNALHNFRWYVVMIVFYMTAIVPKARVYIHDRILPNDSSFVDNVPIGLAATAGFFSETGHWMTGKFERAFSLPNGAVRYSGNGLLFAHRLLAAVQSTSLPDGGTKNNFAEFFKNCVVLDGIGHHRFTWEDIRRSKNLMRFFSEKTARNVAFFEYSDGTESVLLPCSTGFREHLGVDLLNMKDDFLRQSSIPLLDSFHDIERGSEVVERNIAAAISYLTGASSTSDDLIMQHALINALDSARMSMAQELGASAVMQGYALHKAELERQTTYQAMGKIANDKLPLLKSIFEAFLYAIFPIIALMAIVNPTKVSFAYAKALLWINLWAPAYALLHFAAVYFSGRIMPDIASFHNGITAAAQAPLLQHNADVVATVGYLALSIPMIAWLLVSQSGAMAASFAGRVLEGYDQSVSSASREAASGNMEIMGQRYQFTSEGMIQQSYTNMYGQEITGHANGTQTIRNPQSSLQISPTTADSVIESTSNAVAKARSVESYAALARASANINVASSIDSMNKALRDTDAVRSATVRSVDGAGEWRYSESEKLAENISEATGLNIATVKEAMASLRGSAGAGGNVLVAKVGGEAGIGGSVRKSKTDSETIKRVADYLANSEVGVTLKSSAREAIDNASSHGTEYSESGANELRQAINEQERTEEVHNSATRDVERAEESHMRAKQLRHDFATNETDGFVNFVASYRPGKGTAASPVDLPLGMTPPQVAQLVNRAARGDADAQAHLTAFQKEYVKSRVSSPGFDLKGKQDAFDEVRQSADREISNNNIRKPVWRSLGPNPYKVTDIQEEVRRDNAHVKETLRMVDDGLREVNERTEKEAAKRTDDADTQLK